MSGEEIQWTRIDEPEFLWGPRPYDTKAGTGGIPRLDMTVRRKVGDMDNAQIAIDVTEHGDGEIEVQVECLCGPCHLLREDFDVVYQAIDHNVYGKPEPGVYFAKIWVEEYGGYFDPKEYDVGLEIALEKTSEEFGER